MRKSMVLTLAFCLLGQPLAFASGADAAGTPDRRVLARWSASSLPAPLVTAANREGTRLAAAPRDTPGGSNRSQPQVRSRSWIGRHPVLFGAAVGAGAGAVSAATMENELFCSGGDEDCFFHGGSRTLVGAGFGAAIGSLAGFIVGLGSK